MKRNQTIPEHIFPISPRRPPLAISLTLPHLSDTAWAQPVITNQTQIQAVAPGTKVTVSWQSVAVVSYFLQRNTDLAASPSFTLLTTDLVGNPGTTSFTDTNVSWLAPLFYRVGVSPP